ncbi:MAG: FAD binding domain-containing protein [Rhodococcus sp. (in: high G+C Gram-positive bacteria)]
MDLGTIENVTMPTRRSELPSGADDTAVIAGGTWLLSEKQDHLRRLVDITAFGWEPLAAVENGVDIAATCTIDQLAATRFAEWPATELFHRCAAALLASFKIWHVATVGGNIALALPAGAMISLTTALDGRALVWGSDGTDRTVAVEDVVIGPGRNALSRGDVLRSIHLPIRALHARTAFRKVALSPEGRSASIVIGRVDTDGQFVLSITASTVRPFVLRFPQPPSAAELTAAIDAAVPATAWYDDPHGAPDWRRHISAQSAHEVLEELT